MLRVPFEPTAKIPHYSFIGVTHRESKPSRPWNTSALSCWIMLYDRSLRTSTERSSALRVTNIEQRRQFQEISVWATYMAVMLDMPANTSSARCVMPLFPNFKVPMHAEGLQEGLLVSSPLGETKKSQSEPAQRDTCSMTLDQVRMLISRTAGKQLQQLTFVSLVPSIPGWMKRTEDPGQENVWTLAEFAWSNCKRFTLAQQALATPIVHLYCPWLLVDGQSKRSLSVPWQVTLPSKVNIFGYHET